MSQAEGRATTLVFISFNNFTRQDPFGDADRRSAGHGTYLLYNPNLHCRVLTSTTNPHPVLLRFILILSLSTPKPPKFFITRILNKIIYIYVYLFHTCYMARPSNPPLSGHPNRTHLRRSGLELKTYVDVPRLSPWLPAE